MSTEHNHCGPCDPCKPRCKKKKKRPRPPRCPDLARLCPASGKFFRRVTLFGADAMSGRSGHVFFDCNGCLSNEQMEAIGALLGTEVMFVRTTDPNATIFDTINVQGGSIQESSGTGALIAAAVIRDLVRCGRADPLTIRFVNTGATIPITFDAQGTPGFTLGPPEFGIVIAGTDRADLIACLGSTVPGGFTEADLIPGLPIQEVRPGPGLLRTVLVPVNEAGLAKIQAIDADDPAFIACQSTVTANTGVFGIFEVFTLATVDPDVDIHARVFSGALGLPEDPISAAPNASLGAYLAQYGLFTPPFSVTVEQGAEAGSPGFVTVDVTDESGSLRISIIGNVNTAAEGVFNVSCPA